RRLGDSLALEDEQQPFVFHQAPPELQTTKLAPEILAPLRARQHDLARAGLSDHAPFAHGIVRTCPAKIRFGFHRLLARASASTVTPYCRLSRYRFSPKRTTCVRG